MKKEKSVKEQSLKDGRKGQKIKKIELLSSLIKEKSLEEMRVLVKEHVNASMTLDQLFRIKLKEAAFEYFDDGHEAFQVIVMLPELSSKTIYSYEKEHKALNGDK
jgi:hypothetical protein